MTCDLEEYLVQDTESESSLTCVCHFIVFELHKYQGLGHVLLLHGLG